MCETLFGSQETPLSRGGSNENCVIASCMGTVLPPAQLMAFRRGSRDWLWPFWLLAQWLGRAARKRWSQHAGDRWLNEMGGAMKVAFWAMLSVAAIALSGCTSAAERAAAVDAQEDMQCRSFGFKPGTESYGNCRLKLTNMRRQEEAAMMNYIMNSPTPRTTTCYNYGYTINCY